MVVRFPVERETVQILYKLGLDVEGLGEPMILNIAKTVRYIRLKRGHLPEDNLASYLAAIIQFLKLNWEPNVIPDLLP